MGSGHWEKMKKIRPSFSRIIESSSHQSLSDREQNQPREKSYSNLSYYYLADELEGTYRGMMIALPPEQWQDLRSLSLTQFSALLQDWAATVKLEAFTSTPRKPKKKKSKPPYDPAHPHVSTARLLAQKKKSRASPD